MAARVIDPARTAVTMRVSTPAGYTDPDFGTNETAPRFT
jgi:hypothetical protein